MLPILGNFCLVVRYFWLVLDFLIESLIAIILKDLSEHCGLVLDNMCQFIVVIKEFTDVSVN